MGVDGVVGFLVVPSVYDALAKSRKTDRIIKLISFLTMRTNMYYTANTTSFGVDNVMGNGTYASAYGSDDTNMHMPDLEVNSY